MNHIVFHEKAEQELLEAIAWYESQVKGLGRIFLDEVERISSTLVEYPESAPVIIENIRCRILGKFPYGIMYSVVKDTVRILAVAHRKRRPFYWAERK
jgi:toxin ParE1/3/4